MLLFLKPHEEDFEEDVVSSVYEVLKKDACSKC